MRIDQVTRRPAEIYGAGIPITTGQRSGGAKRGSGSQANEGEDGGEEDEDAEYEYDDEYDVFTANFGGRIGQEGTQGDK